MNKKLVIFGAIVISAVFLAFLFIKSSSQAPVVSSLPVSPHSDSDWVKGEKGAKVSLIEYSDLQCPACLAYYPVIKQLADEFGESVNFVYRHFPLRAIHFNSQLASQAAEAAGLQGKFWEMHDLLFEKQESWAKATNPEELFIQYAKEMGLNLEQFNKDLNSDVIKQEVEKDYQSGLAAGVNATPTFFLSGIKIQNPRSFDEFKGIIEKEISQ